MEEALQCRDSTGVEDETSSDMNEIEENFSTRESTMIKEVNFSGLEVEENYAARKSIAADGNLEPHVGMEFESEQATYTFYNEYAKSVGFGIRKRFIRRSRTNNEVIGRTYVCSREGLKQTRKEVDNPRPNTRSDCKAMMKVKRYGNGRWVMIKFIKEHNHELYPRSACIFQSQLINAYEDVVGTPKSSETLVPKITSEEIKQFYGVKNVEVTDKHCRRFYDNELRESLSAEDARTIYEYFMQTQVSNPRFFYAMELDEQQRLRNVFWTDTKSRVAYSYFGDVVTFDTTCLMNKYETKLVLFLGVNHHGQSLLLGCALVTDETKASFQWVFQTWLTVMQGSPPKAIITDQHKAIKAAIAEIFPETCHRICLWHIMKRVPEKLGGLYKPNTGFMHKFDKCIYDSLTADEFERRWKNLVEAYGLADDKWLETLYEDRKSWVPVYIKHNFFAGMSISQRSESLIFFFDDCVGQKTSLKESMSQIELALQRSYNNEEHANLETYRKTPNLITGSPYEAQMASIYTKYIFRKFQDEILRIPSCNAVNIRQENGANATYLVKELVMKPSGERGVKDYPVVWNGSGTTVSCLCRLFEFQGYLCGHAMVVLFAVGVYDIPSHYILKRWTRDAKSTDLLNDVKESSPEFTAKCFSDLRADAIKLAEEGSLSKERYRAAKIFLKEALIKVASLDKGSANGSIRKSMEDQQVKW